MKHFIVYLINGQYKLISTTVDIMNHLDRLHVFNINYDAVDYIVPLAQHIDEKVLEYRKYLPDGSSIWKKDKLIEKKVKEMLIKRNSLFQKLDIDFLISLETPNNRKTEVIKNNKKFLRDLSYRTEIQHIHDCSKIEKFNPFYNIVDIEILDPGYGCSELVPQVIISSPQETETNYGITASAKAIRGAKGELTQIIVEKVGCGYISNPEIKISGFDGENAKHPILKAVISNII